MNESTNESQETTQKMVLQESGQNNIESNDKKRSASSSGEYKIQKTHTSMNLHDYYAKKWEKK
jgi:hypothetical protein